MTFLKMGANSGLLKQVNKSKNCLQPIFEAITNAVESYLEEREREIKVVFELAKIDTEIGDISVKIIDSGDGFELTKLSPVIGRLNTIDNSKGQNNRGCGRAQFLHYFKSVEIIGKSFQFETEDDKTSNRINQKRLHLIGTIEKDWEIIDDKTQDIPETTTIYLQNYTDNRNEFYEKIADLNKLKNEIITSCFLKLLNKNIKITLKQQFIGDEENKEITITTQDFEEYKKNSQEETIEVKYQIYKIKKDHNNKDISEFGYCDDGKSEKFKMNIYKLPTNFENHVYLCANDVAVKDILQSDKIFDKNITIEENDNKNKLLVLISDADGCNFLNDHSNGERDNFDIQEQSKIEKEIKDNGVATLETNYSKTPILFYDDLVDSSQNKIVECFPKIKENVKEKREKIQEMIKQYRIAHNISDNEAMEMGLNDGRTIKDIKDINKLHKIVGDSRGEVKERLHQQSVEKFEKVLETITKDEIDEKNIQEFYNTLNEFHNSINENNRVELSNYILRRTWQVELFKKLVEKNVKEEFIHNLIFKKSTNSNKTQNHGLWMLNEDFANYDYITSDIKLRDIEYKGEKVFSSDIEDKSVLELCGAKNLDKGLKKPDILIFHELGAVVIIELKRPSEACFEYLWEPEVYCRLIATKTIKTEKFKTFYCYIIGEKYGSSSGFFKKTADGKGYFCNSYPIKELQGDEKFITNAYFEVNNYKNYSTLAELRNKNFSDKLLQEGDYDEIKERVDEIVKNITEKNTKQQN